MNDNPNVAQPSSTTTKATKIVATIGPITETEELMEQLIQAGMNVARFNTKHGDVAWHQERMRRMRAVSDRLGIPVAILLDLQGPEIRLDLPTGVDSFPVAVGDHVTFTSDRTMPGPNVIYVPQEVITSESEGNHLFIDDGVGEFFIVAKDETALVTEVHEAFEVKKRKTVNTPGVVINMPSLIPSDLAQLDGIDDNLVDFVALSFVRNTEDITILRQELANRNLHCQVVSKIENQEAINNLTTIIPASDAVMVARGDLGVEIPYEELTRWQKEIILQSRQFGKPVITATQMLKSMVDNPIPTRAEVSDIANAIYDGTDAVMLSEETAIGKYPVKAVKTQARIAAYSEQYAHVPQLQVDDFDVSSAITHAAMVLLQHHQDPLHSFDINKVICLSSTGTTAHYLARSRYIHELHALTTRPQTYRQLSLAYGVIPHLVDLSSVSLDNLRSLSDKLKELGITQPGETVLVIHGSNWTEPGLTNSLRILRVD